MAIKMGVVRSSDLVKYNRMDAKFFLALEKIKDTIESISGQYSKEQAFEILFNIPEDHLKVLIPFARSNLDSRNKDAILAAIKEYPLESLALAVTSIEVVESIKTRQMELNDQMATISASVELLRGVSLRLGNTA